MDNGLTNIFGAEMDDDATLTEEVNDPLDYKVPDGMMLVSATDYSTQQEATANLQRMVAEQGQQIGTMRQTTEEVMGMIRQNQQVDRNAHTDPFSFLGESVTEEPTMTTSTPADNNNYLTPEEADKRWEDKERQKIERQMGNSKYLRDLYKEFPTKYANMMPHINDLQIDFGSRLENLATRKPDFNNQDLAAEFDGLMTVAKKKIETGVWTSDMKKKPPNLATGGQMNPQTQTRKAPAGPAYGTREYFHQGALKSKETHDNLKAKRKGAFNPQINP